MAKIGLVMKVIAQSGSHRIVDDAPISLAMEGVGLYSIEEQLNGDWWCRFIPRAGNAQPILMR